MSLFRTVLSVDLKQVLDVLPKGYFLHNVTFDKEKREVSFQWEYEKFESGLTVPVDFSLSDLTKKLLPDGVRNLDKVTKLKSEKPPVLIKPAPKTIPVAALPLIRTQTDYEAALVAGDDIEYQGLLPVWKPVDPAIHSYTPGYLYRKKPLDKTAKLI